MIGGAVITNGPQASSLTVENTVPILRNRDILTEESAKTVCQQLYFVIQLMYIGGVLNPDLASLYSRLASEVLAAAPSARDLIAEMTGYVLQEEYYPALKVARKLIKFEEELLNYVPESS